MIHKLILSLITTGLFLSIGMTPIKKEYSANQYEYPIRLFKQQGRAQLPTWFQSLATTRAGDDGVGAFVALMAAAESSGSSSGDAAAAAAAGGGASGAY
jgi:hypothetical protein